MGRRKIAAEIAKELRRSQQQLIKEQKAPDVSPYQARKRQPLREKKGSIKRAMFQKLRTSRYMKASGRNDAAVVEFTGKVLRIARVHHYGLRDQPNTHARDIQYDERQLLGFTDEDEKILTELLLKHINRNVWY
ncbi:phage virion morphogenesis protein [Lelliottia sp. V89_10]|uniref:phage virion morphogenesis protein n=1 Tax=Lelliottia wanjuensis TaxID=3050585 RepID=UPI00249DEC32|nr:MULTISPECIES: phage virion morphogenesis protein [unclassified Lelliottia]MDI3362949.1 phage virion morphogenesis protein [Lelliottia sp. V89_13]MDK9547839.1 phage virion morphogenesis protein [Lelliottia sp. V89_5]MDK9597865.1 phage virion morphogenesis protein [Lelliottia sp. V89_10]